MPKAKCAAGRGHRPTSTALGRQQAGRQAGSMSPIAMRHRARGVACNITQHNTTHPSRKIPQTQTQSMQHAFTSLPLSKPQLFPPTQPTTPHFPSKPTFTIQAAVHPRKESILNLIGLILLIDRFTSYLFFFLFFFCSLHFFLHSWFP